MLEGELMETLQELNNGVTEVVSDYEKVYEPTVQVCTVDNISTYRGITYAEVTEAIQALLKKKGLNANGNPINVS